MNYTELIDIIERLKTIEPKKAKRLAKLLYKCISEVDAEKLKIAEKRLSSSVYGVFLDLIDKDSASKIFNLGVAINEQEHLIEQRAGDGWRIYSDGCFKIGKVDDQFKIEATIPRFHGIGFILPIDAGEAEKEFYEEYKHSLDILSGDIDNRQTCVTFDYRVRDCSVPRDLVEQLIDFLGISRVINKERQNNNIQKKKEF